jgi:hypothetical protein
MFIRKKRIYTRSVGNIFCVIRATILSSLTGLNGMAVPLNPDWRPGLLSTVPSGLCPQ